MNILIIEDEEIASNRLENRLKEISPTHHVMAKIGSVKEAICWLRSHVADLIFLDIQLSDGISFSIFDHVQVTTPIIFTTAHNQYAIKAFDLNSVAYLLKPVRKTELEDSLRKYKSMQSAFSIDFAALLADYQGEHSKYRQRFLIRIGDNFRKLEAVDIAYCYALKKDVFAKTFSNQTLPMDYSLDALQRLLEPKRFFRINRQYLVNMTSIQNMVALSRSKIKLELKPQPIDELGPIVSIHHSADFKKWMNS